MSSSKSDEDIKQVDLHEDTDAGLFQLPCDAANVEQASSDTKLESFEKQTCSTVEVHSDDVDDKIITDSETITQSKDECGTSTSSKIKEAVIRHKECTVSEESMSTSAKHRSRDAKQTSSKKSQEKAQNTASTKLSKDNSNSVGRKSEKKEKNSTKPLEVKHKSHERGNKKIDSKLKEKPMTEDTKHKVAKSEDKITHHQLGERDKSSPQKKVVKTNTSKSSDAAKKQKRSKESSESAKSTGEDSSKIVKQKSEVKSTVKLNPSSGLKKKKKLKTHSGDEVTSSLKMAENTKTSDLELKESTATDTEKSMEKQVLPDMSVEQPTEDDSQAQAINKNDSSPSAESSATKLSGKRKRKRPREEKSDETPVKPKKTKLDSSVNNDNIPVVSDSAQKVKKMRLKKKVSVVGAEADSMETGDMAAESSHSGDTSTPISGDVKIQKRRQNVIGGGSQQPLLVDDRLPEGWKRLVVQRQGGASIGKYDVYIIGPNMHKFRSRKELGTYIETEGIDLQAQSFDFSVFGKELANADDSAPQKSTHKPTKKPKPADAIMEDEKPVKRSYKQRVKKGKLTYEQVREMVTSDFLSTRMSNRSLKWTPPRSPYNLIQENLFHNPWQLLVATILLNKSLGSTATPIIYGIFRRWPTPEAMGYADEKELAVTIRPLGLHKKRASSIKKFSEEFLTREWTYPNELHGIGKYGNDSYRMFCVNEWRYVQPSDVMLTMYKNWLQNNWAALCNNTNNCLGLNKSEDDSPQDSDAEVIHRSRTDVS